MRLFRNNTTPLDNDGTGFVFSFLNDAAETINYARISAIATDVSDGTEDSTIAFEVATAGSLLQEKMRITSVGNVGIGTTAPTSLLHVTGAVTGKALVIFDETGDQDIFTASASGTPKFTIARNGNLTATGTITGLTGITSSGTITFSGLGTDGPVYTASGVLNSEQYLDLTRGGTDADLSGVATGGLIYKGASALAGTAALTGVLKGNGASAPTAITSTTNYVTYWSDNNTIAGEQYLATSRGGLGANVTAVGAGEVLYSTATTTYDSLAAGTSGETLLSGGAGAPSWGTLGLTYGGTNADLSGVATGGLIYKGASALAGTAALTGMLKGNGASAPTNVSRGGTGVDASSASNGQLLIGNGSGFALSTLTAGTGITINNGSGSIEVVNSSPGSSQNIFKNFAVSGQNTVIADNNDDTLTLAEGANITITTNATTDTVTIASSAGGGTPGGSDGQVQYNNGGAFGGASNLFYNDTNNKVGIGTTAPTSLLHITGAVTGKALVIFDETGDQNIFTASASGTPVAYLDRSGNFMADGVLSFGDSTPDGNAYNTIGTGDKAAAGVGDGEDLFVSDYIEAGTGMCIGSDCVTNWDAGGRWTLASNVLHPNTTTWDMAFDATTVTAAGFGYDENINTLYLGYDTEANPTLEFKATDSDVGTFGFNTNDAFYFSGANVGIGTTGPEIQFEIAKTGADDVGPMMTLRNTSAGINQTTDHILGEINFAGNDRFSGDTGIGAKIVGHAEFAWNATSLDNPSFLAFYTNPNGAGALAERMRINSAGNVGIGTTGPDNLLDLVGGSIQLQFADSKTDVTRKQGRIVTKHYTNAEEPLTVIYSDANTSTNSIHIGGGTSVGNAATQIGFWTGATNTTTTGTSRLVINSSGNMVFADGGNIQIDQVRARDGDGLALYDDGSNGLFIKDGGNVGIGTTAPSNKLDVAGTAEMTGIKMTTSPSAGYVLTSDGSGVGSWTDLSGSGGPWTLSGTALYPDASSSNVLIGSTTAGDAVHKLLVTGTNVGKALAVFNETGANDIFVASASGSPKFLIDNSGNVGIGTTGPDHKLHVIGATLIGAETLGVFIQNAGSAALSSSDSVLIGRSGTGGVYPFNEAGNLVLQPRGSTSSRDIVFLDGGGGVNMIIEDGGNVGIGTTGPSYNLHIDSSTAGQLGIERGGVGQKGQIVFLTSGSPTWFVGTSDSGDAGDGSEFFIGETTGGASPAIWVESGGNVGIGTTSPDYKLQVNGTIAPETTDQDLGTAALRWDLLANTINADSTVTFSGLTANRLVTTTTGGELATSITSANVDASVSDDTGSGLLVFATSPTFTTQITTPQIISSADLTINPTGGDVNLGSGDNLNLTDSTDLFFGSTSLGEITGAADSGAYKVGAFNEFTNSAETNVQGVLDDLDQHIEDLETGSSGVWTDAAGYIYPTAAGNYGGTGLQITDAGGLKMDENLIVDGNVGIGTTSPGAELEVDGEIRAGNAILPGGQQGGYSFFSGSHNILAYADKNPTDISGTSK